MSFFFLAYCFRNFFSIPEIEKGVEGRQLVVDFRLIPMYVLYCIRTIL